MNVDELCDACVHVHIYHLIGVNQPPIDEVIMNKDVNW